MNTYAGNRRQELCRNFLRGSCKYGANCKYLHSSQQQPVANSAWWSEDNRDQKPNPFGFGAGSRPANVTSAQPQKPNYIFGLQSRNPPVKPFENKWTRNSNSTPQKQADVPPPEVHSVCTDPNVCKQIIVDDFKNEAPLWKLTCYGHRKHGPCDIVGDISYEELRARAYESASLGSSLQSIIQIERDLLHSKLAEFDSFLRKPYTINPSGFPPFNSFPGSSNVTQLGGSQINALPMFSSFSQLMAAGNIRNDFRPSNSGMVGGSPFAQPNSFQDTKLSFGGGGMNFGSPAQGMGSLPGFNISNSSNNYTTPGNYQPSQFHVSNRQSVDFFGELLASSSSNQILTDQQEGESEDDGIWLKESWDIGEIPENPPPLKYCVPT